MISIKVNENKTQMRLVQTHSTGVRLPTTACRIVQIYVAVQQRAGYSVVDMTRIWIKILKKKYLNLYDKSGESLN